MATSLLTVGTTAANSSDLVVAAGTPVTVVLKNTAPAGLDSTALVIIQIKDETSAYTNIGQLDVYNPATVITGPGTYRFRREIGAACGVFSA